MYLMRGKFNKKSAEFSCEYCCIGQYTEPIFVCQNLFWPDCTNTNFYHAYISSRITHVNTVSVSIQYGQKVISV